MNLSNLPHDELKDVLKAALIEALEERRDLFHAVFSEVLEDFLFSRGDGDELTTEATRLSEFFARFEAKA